MLSLTHKYPQRPSTATSLDSQQRNRQKATERALERDFSFQKYQESLPSCQDVIVASSLSDQVKARILECGTECYVETSPSTGDFRLRGKRCGSRACPLCRVRYAHKKQEEMDAALASIAKNRAKLFTLTMLHTFAPLKTQVENLWKSFERLRHRSIWKQAVAGAIAVLEVTFNEEKSQWHPHLHVIVDGLYIGQGFLTQVWRKTSGGSTQTDVRAIRNTARTASYLTTYLMKAPTLPTTKGLGLLIEWVEATVGMRCVRKYGSLRSVEPQMDPDRYDPRDWVRVDCLLSIITRAMEGSVRDRYILGRLRGRNDMSVPDLTLEECRRGAVPSPLPPGFAAPPHLLPCVFSDSSIPLENQLFGAGGGIGAAPKPGTSCGDHSAA